MFVMVVKVGQVNMSMNQGRVVVWMGVKHNGVMCLMVMPVVFVMFVPVLVLSSRRRSAEASIMTRADKRRRIGHNHGRFRAAKRKGEANAASF